MTALRNYNGIVLLTSYLQRVYVQENIMMRIGEQVNLVRMQQAKEFIDDLNAILPIFEQTKMLTTTQNDRIRTISQQTKLLMEGYFKENPTFYDKLSIVGSSLYGEKMMNDGILRLGTLFQTDVGQDFEKRVQFYGERTQFIDAFVHTISQGEIVDDQVKGIVEKWYVGVKEHQIYVMQDLNQVDELLQML